MSESVPLTPVPPAALAAFLRGVERRGALFAQLQCGDAEHGDMVLALAMRAFSEQAAGQSMADWPRNFWRQLVTASFAHTPVTGAQWPVSVAYLGVLAAQDRQVLLSRLAAGLPEDEAVEVLGTDLGHYRAHLATACPKDQAGEPDPAGWRALAEAIQQQMRDLPTERLARLARLRERAQQSAAPPLRPPPVHSPRVPAAEDGQVSRAGPPTGRGQGVRWWGWGVLGLVTLAAALAWWKWPQGGSTPGERTEHAGQGWGLAQDPVVEYEALPPVEVPAQTTAVQDQLALHPDLDVLLDADSASLSNDAAFYAWYLADAQQLASTDRHADTAAQAELQQQEEGRDTTF